MEVSVSHPPKLFSSPSTIGKYAWSSDDDNIDAIGRIHVLLRQVGKIDLCLIHHALHDTFFALRCCRAPVLKPVHLDAIGRKLVGWNTNNGRFLLASPVFC